MRRLPMFTLVRVGVILALVSASSCQLSPPTPTLQVSSHARPTSTPTWTPKPIPSPTHTRAPVWPTHTPKSSSTRIPMWPTRTRTLQTVSHVVQKGETLSSIARKYGVTVDELVAWNKNSIRNPDLIHVGEKFVIKPGIRGKASPTHMPRSIAPPINHQPSQPPPCDCGGNYYNCDNFPTQATAQACFNYCWSVVGYDVHRLDRDGDRIACEWNP